MTMRSIDHQKVDTKPRIRLCASNQSFPDDVLQRARNPPPCSSFEAYRGVGAGVPFNILDPADQTPRSAHRRPSNQPGFSMRVGCAEALGFRSFNDFP